ncbi:MAG: hypothetical protein WC659_00850 [Patescibacteria group bacterium]
MDDLTCTTCGVSAEGWKCSMCGAEADEHDSHHSCGGSYCQPKCSGCDEASDNCSC